MSTPRTTADSPSTELAVRPLGQVLAEHRVVTPSMIAELERLVDVVADLQAASHAQTTAERYIRQWERFVSWCTHHHLASTLPVPAEFVMLYVADWATSEPAPAHSTVVQALAAIDWVHADQHLDPPRSAELTKLRRGVRNRLGVAPRRKAAPLLLSHLVPLGRILLAPTRAQIRDAIVIGLRSHGLSYGEITALDIRDVSDMITSFDIRTTRRALRIPPGDVPLGLGALLARWLTIRGSDEGPLVCRLRSDQSVIELPISIQSVRSIILKWAARAGVDLAHGTVPETAESVTLMASALELTPSSVRNMACIWLLWAGALRSDELVHVRIRHLTFEERGLTLIIPRSKTDQAGQGMVAFIPRGEHTETDVVGAVERWVELLRAAGAVDDSFIFCPIDRHENLYLFEEGPDGTKRPVSAVGGPAVTRMLRTSLCAAGLSEEAARAFSSHSGKRGIATQLARSTADISEIAKVTRHKSLQTAKGYVEEEQRKTTSALLKLDL